MKKILSLLVAVLFVGVANAQSLKSTTFALEAGFGSQVELSGRLERSFGKYLAWDIVTLKYAHAWDKNYGQWSIKTGIRGYAPELAKMGPVSLRPSAALDFGYVGAHASAGGYSSYDSMFGLDFTLNILEWKNLSLGYGLSSFHKNGVSSQDHYARIAVKF